MTSSTGCTATSSATTVVINPPVSAAISPSSAIYCGSNVTLTASAGASYLWSNGAVTQSVSVGAGTYTVTVTSAAGCTGTASRTVSSGTAATPTISPSGTVIQCGGTVTLTSSAGTSYLWSNGSTAQSVVVGTGSYTVRVTNSSGCSAVSAPTYVTINANPTASITPSGTLTLCTGTTQTLTAGNATSYAWSTGATTQSINVSTGGSYYVTINNSTGCSSTSAPVVVSYYDCNCQAPTGAIITNIWKASARVQWTYNAQATRYRVTVTQVTDPTKTQTKYWRGGDTVISFVNLRSGTQYSVTIVPVCGGTTGSSTTLYFVTKP